MIAIQVDDDDILWGLIFIRETTGRDVDFFIVTDAEVAQVADYQTLFSGQLGNSNDFGFEDF